MKKLGKVRNYKQGRLTYWLLFTFSFVLLISTSLIYFKKFVEKNSSNKVEQNIA